MFPHSDFNFVPPPQPGLHPSSNSGCEEKGSLKEILGTGRVKLHLKHFTLYLKKGSTRMQNKATGAPPLVLKDGHLVQGNHQGGAKHILPGKKRHGKGLHVRTRVPAKAAGRRE